MQVIDTLNALDESARGAVVAIGNMDGVHPGHVALIAEAKNRAEELGAPLAVMTFEPHPRSFFRPDSPPYRITPKAQKLALLEDKGVEIVYAIQFDQDFAQISAHDFIARVLHEQLATKHIVIGYDFIFGHDRQGNAELLTSRGEALGMGVSQVGAVTSTNGMPYSSSRIRDAIAEGHMQDASALLSRPFAIEATVQQGEQRGRGMGFPTLNFALGEYIEPRYGVYAVRCEIDSEAFAGVANFGVRPTFDDDTPLLEVHLFDTDSDFYGKEARVEFIEFIRGEQQFESLDALKQQIEKDCATARSMLD